MSDVLERAALQKHPTVSLVAKVGSILAHIEEAESADGHAFDWIAVQSLMRDPEVRAWLKSLRKGGLLPKSRKP